MIDPKFTSEEYWIPRDTDLVEGFFQRLAFKHLELARAIVEDHESTH